MPDDDLVQRMRAALRRLPEPEAEIPPAELEAVVEGIAWRTLRLCERSAGRSQ